MSDSTFAWTGTYFARVKHVDADSDLFVELMAEGLSAIGARVASSRLDKVENLAPGLNSLTAPAGLPDIIPASTRLAEAVLEKQTIGIVTDHDVDGVSSHAVILAALRGYGHVGTRSYIGNRLKHGYGLSDPVADKILDDMPAVVVTADCGSADEARIKRLRDAGIDVIVTDHHEIPLDGPPASAFAVVSPARDESEYGDAAIAGCMVSWLLMCAVRRRLIESCLLPADTPTLAHLLDYVGLGTVADCVTLGKSHNNRAVVRHALRLVSTSDRPCWIVARERGCLSNPASSLDFGFQVGPRINARGRLDDAMAGVHFLLASTVDEANAVADLLEDENAARKAIERDLVDSAVAEADSLVKDGFVGLPIWLPNGHPGVHGIVASRIVERFGAPVVCLSPHFTDPNIITGSARSAGGVDIKVVLDHVAESLGDDMLKHGGHKGAGGLSIKASALDSLVDSFNAAVYDQIMEIPGPELVTDGVCSLEEADAVPAMLNAIEPFGRGFEQPVFEFAVSIVAIKSIGKGEHLSLVVRDSLGRQMRCVWFRARLDSLPLPVKAGSSITLYGSPVLNDYLGKVSTQIIVKGIAVT